MATTYTPQQLAAEVKKLNDRQKAFISAYAGCLNATRAARAAGYSEATARQMGSQCRSHPVIRAEIERRLSERKMTGAEVIARLERQAEFDLADCYTEVEVERTVGRGKTAKTIKEKHWRFDFGKAVQLGVTDLIRKIKVDARTGSVTVEGYNVQQALALLGKHHGLLGDNDTLPDEDDAGVGAEGDDDLDEDALLVESEIAKDEKLRSHANGGK